MILRRKVAIRKLRSRMKKNLKRAKHKTRARKKY